MGRNSVGMKRACSVSRSEFDWQYPHKMIDMMANACHPSIKEVRKQHP